MKRKSIVMITTVTLFLVGCSYIEGVFRSLSFERGVSHNDFLCLAETLISQGYNARYSVTNKSVYYDLKHPDRTYSASFRSVQRDKEGNLMEATKKIGHGATYDGSEPITCEDIKPAASMLASIEDKVLPICHLSLTKKPKQKIHCKNS